MDNTSVLEYEIRDSTKIVIFFSRIAKIIRNRIYAV